MPTVIRGFLDHFEKCYQRALVEGTVEPMKEGMEFDLEYYVNWYVNGKFPVEEPLQPVVVQEEHVERPVPR